MKDFGRGLTVENDAGMENNLEDTAHKTAGTAFAPSFAGAKVLLSETPKAVTPFGGLISFVACLEQIGFGVRVAKAMPFPASTSNNAIPLAHTLTAFLLAVVTGASRFAPTDWLRGDRALHAILGIKRFPGDDTVRAFFGVSRGATLRRLGVRCGPDYSLWS